MMCRQKKMSIVNWRKLDMLFVRMIFALYKVKLSIYVFLYFWLYNSSLSIFLTMQQSSLLGQRFYFEIFGRFFNILFSIFNKVFRLSESNIYTIYKVKSIKDNKAAKFQVRFVIQLSKCLRVISNFLTINKIFRRI